MDDGTDVDRNVDDGWLRIRREWQPGTETALELVLRPRLTETHPRVGAVRGSLAIEYGPLVDCLEQADQVDDLDLDAIELSAKAPLATRSLPDRLGGGVAVIAQAVRRHPAAPGTSQARATPTPYNAVRSASPSTTSASDPRTRKSARCCSAQPAGARTAAADDTAIAFRRLLCPMEPCPPTRAAVAAAAGGGRAPPAGAGPG